MAAGQGRRIQRAPYSSSATGAGSPSSVPAAVRKTEGTSRKRRSAVDPALSAAAKARRRR